MLPSRRGTSPEAPPTRWPPPPAKGLPQIQTSPHQIHAANSRIRPDPAGPDEEDADASERAPSLDLAKQVTGVLPPDTQVHHRLATHAAEGRRP